MSHENDTAGRYFGNRRLGRREPGYVYLINTGIDYKIGKAVNVRKRFNQLKDQGVINKGSYLVKIIHSEYSYDLERHLHDLFEHRHVSREFFALTEREIEWICKLPDDLPYGLIDEDIALPR